MDLRRLQQVRDICPRKGAVIKPVHATHWMAKVMQSFAPALLHDNGYTVAVADNAFVTWHRTYTHDDELPTIKQRHAILTIHEWIPGITPTHTPMHQQFGPPHKEGIAELRAGEDFTRDWSSHARRHLSAFRKQKDITLRFGTFNDVADNIYHSQIPKTMQRTFLEVLARHMRLQPHTIEILIAEHPQLGILACFVAGNVDEIKQSYYLTGFFNAEHTKSHAMTGLIEWWFKRSIERGYTSVNFGHMCGPNPPLIDPSIGYSNFKTHFGIQRVWFPGSYWKLRVSVRHLFSSF